MGRLNKILPILACLALPFAFSSAGADEFIDTKPLLKDAVAGSQGLEFVAPLFVEIDNDQDFYPDKITAKFKVYTAGSTNRLFNTPQKAFNPPAQPSCANAFYDDWDWLPTFFGENNTHTGVGIQFIAECENNNTFKEVSGAFVYVADTRVAGSAWAKTWNQELLSVAFVDWDDDQQDEVMVVLGVLTNSAFKSRVIFIDKLTGVVESDKKYPLLETFDF
jgi:hypothetical protein